MAKEAIEKLAQIEAQARIVINDQEIAQRNTTPDKAQSKNVEGG